jgi:hypothetical protein
MARGRRATNHCVPQRQTTQSFRQMRAMRRRTGTTSTLQYENGKILYMDIGAQNRFNCPSGAQNDIDVTRTRDIGSSAPRKSVAKFSGVMG